MNDEQIKVYNQMVNFLDDEKEQIFQLDAAGGCGKSYTVSRLLNNNHVIHGYRVVICTPTHKALHVLQNSMKIKNPNSTLVFKTIDSWLGSVVDYDERGNEKMDYTFEITIPTESFGHTDRRSAGREAYKRIKSWEFNILVIDEVSMVNQLHYTIITKIIQVKNPKLKIITLGDICQLPPVQPENFYENIYTPFCIEHKIEPLRNNKESYFYSKPINATLYKNMRCENPQHNELLNEIRKYIIGEYQQRIHLNTFQFEIQKLIRTTENTYFNNFINSFCEDFKKGKKVIILNNKGEPKTDKSPWLLKVSDLNIKIREILFPNSSQEFNTGEQVIWTKNIYTDCPIFTNGQVSILKNVNIIENFKLPIFESQYLLFTEEEQKWLNDNREYNVYKIDIEHDGEVLRTYQGYKIQLFSRQKWNNFSGKLKELLVSKSKNMKKTERKVVFKEYYEYIRKYDLPINTYYATTIHSSQGSTFEKVYVNYDNFKWLNKTVNNRIQYLKLLYTSFSRTKSNIIWT